MPNLIRARSLNDSQRVHGRASRRFAYSHALQNLLLIGILGAGLFCQAAGPNLADLVDRAKAAQAAGDTTLARALLEPALRSPSIRPTDRAALYLMRAHLFMDEAAPVSARLDAERATRYDPTNGDALSLRARLDSDPSVSAKLYLKAARQGVTEAQREAGARLMDGVGIAADLRKARYWLQQAANAGDPPAMSLLARSYRDAIDPAQRDPGLAASWLQRAASAGAAAGVAPTNSMDGAATKPATLTTPPPATPPPATPALPTPALPTPAPANDAQGTSTRNQVRIDAARLAGPRAMRRAVHPSPGAAATGGNRSTNLRAEGTHN